MMFKRFSLVTMLLLSLMTSSCRKESPFNESRAIIGISADVESLNPLYSFSVVEGNITELLYLSLVQHRWNETASNIDTEPMLAESWEWNSDSTSITLFLRDDVYWSDGVQFTADDVIFSFDVYSDPDVQSKLYGTFNSYYTEKDLSIDLEKTFEVHNLYQLTINFLPESTPRLFNIDFPLIPWHIYSKEDRKNISASAANLNPVTNGAYQFEKWNRNQSLILRANKNSFLYEKTTINELIFKVIPDYTSRIIQLKKGEIDLLEDIKPDDIEDLESEDHLIIKPIKGREYEYLGWNNIEPVIYNKTKRVVPHKFFGNPNVRKALTHAVNRKEILEEYLHNYGEIAVGPVTPIFRNAHSEITPYSYDPAKARAILAQEGWADRDNNGILEKGNNEFIFTLHIPGGNPRRNFTATLIKNNLKAVGIEMKIATLELGIFIEEMFAKKFDAWLASWFVPLPVDLKTYWYSDLKKTPLNAASYQNKIIDQMLEELSSNISNERRIEIYKKFQAIMHKNEPVSFLYWLDNIVAYNKRIKDIDVNPLGFIHHSWEWSVDY